MKWLKTIIVNGRIVSFEAILSNQEDPNDDDENALFIFCRQWFSSITAFEQKTSGSTGLPKTIMITRAQMLLSAQMTLDYLKISGKETTALVCLSPAYIAGKMMLVRAFIAKMNIVFVSPCANPLTKTETAIDFTALVPYQIKNVLENPQTTQKVNTIKTILVGGAPINHYLETLIKERTSNTIFQTFGMTETISHIALRDVKNEREYHTIGDVVIEEVNDRLCITSSLTSDKPLLTNDVVKITSPKSFLWLGRSDNVINSGGIKIQIEILEKEIDILFTKNNIRNRFFIFSIPDKNFGEAIAIALEGSPQKFDETLFKNLDFKSKPVKCFYTPKFEETPTQKIDRIKTQEKLLA